MMAYTFIILLQSRHFYNQCYLLWYLLHSRLVSHNWSNHGRIQRGQSSLGSPFTLAMHFMWHKMYHPRVFKYTHIFLFLKPCISLKRFISYSCTLYDIMLFNEDPTTLPTPTVPTEPPSKNLGGRVPQPPGLTPV